MKVLLYLYEWRRSRDCMHHMEIMSNRKGKWRLTTETHAFKTNAVWNCWNIFQVHLNKIRVLSILIIVWNETDHNASVVAGGQAGSDEAGEEVCRWWAVVTTDSWRKGRHGCKTQIQRATIRRVGFQRGQCRLPYLKAKTDTAHIHENIQWEIIVPCSTVPDT